jgi:hypothetical protein
MGLGNICKEYNIIYFSAWELNYSSAKYTLDGVKAKPHEFLTRH